MDELPENSSVVGGASGSGSCSYEESGWTQYLVDFPSSNREDNSCSTFFDVSSSSLISDAATGGYPTNPTHAGNYTDVCSFVDGRRKFQKKLRFKKSRRDEITEEDSLEDTASSPVNSPKVSDLDEQNDMPNKKISSDFNNPLFQEKEENSGGGQEEEKGRISFDVKNNDLRSRELCLVPLSMFVNYRY